MTDYRNKIALTESIPNDPLFDRQNWLRDTSGFDGDINVTSVWPDYTGRGVRIGVYDDGIEAANPEFAGSYDASLHLRWPWVGREVDGRVGIGELDHSNNSEPRHGTPVAGIIAANRDGSGVVGVAYDATVTAVPMFNELRPSGSEAYLLAAYRHQANFDVVNHSYWFGENFPTYNQAQADALKFVADTGRDGLGTIVVAAAGNERSAEVPRDTNGRGVLYADRHTVTVAALNGEGALADFGDPENPFSNGGTSLLVSAFGQNELTVDRTGEAGFNQQANTPSSPRLGDDVGFNGTSAAAPMVTGVVALMLEANPDLGWRDVREILAASARMTPGMSEADSNEARDWNGGGHAFSRDFGFGIVDAHAAVRLAETWTEQKTSADELFWFTGWTGANLTIAPGRVQSLTLEMDPNIDLETVELDLRMSLDGWHGGSADIGEMTISLTSPSGTTSQLVGYEPLRNQDFDGRLVVSSNEFLGEGSAGTWTIRITTSGVTAATLTDWQVNTYGSAVSDNDTYIYTDDFGALAAADPSRATLSDATGNDTINAAATRYNTLIDLTGTQRSIIAGTDVTVRGIENAISGDGDDTLIGNFQGNTLRGGRGDDHLVSGGWNLSIGGGGRDLLDGGAGDDTFVVNGRGPIEIVGGAGTDTVAFEMASAPNVTVDLAAGTGSILEFGPIRTSNLWLSGVENVTGGAGNDTLSGDAGANRLAGGLGTDVLTGRGGNDVYVGVNASDTIVEEAGGGRDHVHLQSGVRSYALGANVEDLTMASSGIVIPPITPPKVPGALPREFVRGNELANVITGNAEANAIDGGAGADVIYGGGGNDVIVGGLGADRLSGGLGTDVFVFRSIGEIGLGAGKSGSDVIADFVSGARPPSPFPNPPSTAFDRIDLSMIDANMTTAADDAFTFGTKVGRTGQLGVSYGQELGQDVTRLSADVSGDNIADFALLFVGHVTFQPDNFIL